MSASGVNRLKSSTSARFNHVILAFSALIGVTGCSVSFPMAGLIDTTPTASLKPQSAAPVAPLPLQAATPSIDMMPTGSIAPVAAGLTKSVKPVAHLPVGPDNGLAALALTPFGQKLKPADLVSARSALSMAMETDKNTRSVAWSSAMTGTSGAFMPVGDSVSQGMEQCRKFKAVLHPVDAEQNESLSGLACKSETGNWGIKSLDNLAKSS